MKLGLYVHIPFCRSKCFYCDFPSAAGQQALYDDYTAALCREISGQGGALSGAVVDTVFIGGGTPTVLNSRQLSTILEAIANRFHLTDDVEISIEANPGTSDAATFHTLRQLGVNRISFGVQSFDDIVLAAIGRSHTAADAVQSVKLARRAGIENINVDLMYGLPGQSLDQLAASLDAALQMEVFHVSAYSLKVEAGTPFDRLKQQGRLLLPDDEVEEAMYETVIDTLSRQGLARYEISNFARPGYQCRHNLKYWHYQPYLGLGAAAHSLLDNERRSNFSDAATYIKTICSDQSPIEFAEQLNCKSAMEEFVFLALRTTTGVQVAAFNSKFQQNFADIYGAVVKNLQLRDLVVCSNGFVRLTKLGMKFGNQVFGEFLL